MISNISIRINNGSNNSNFNQIPNRIVNDKNISIVSENNNIININNKNINSLNTSNIKIIKIDKKNIEEKSRNNFEERIDYLKLQTSVNIKVFENKLNRILNVIDKKLDVNESKEEIVSIWNDDDDNDDNYDNDHDHDHDDDKDYYDDDNYDDDD